MILIYLKRSHVYGIVSDKKKKKHTKIGMDAYAVKANSLRAKCNREIAKENRDKSADDLYENKWIFMEKMHFIKETEKTSSTVSSLGLTNDDWASDIEDTTAEKMATSVLTRTSSSSKRI